MSSVIWTLLLVAVLGVVLANTMGNRWIPRRWRWQTWTLGMQLIAGSLALAGGLLLFQEPWNAALIPIDEISKLHGRQAVGGGLINAILSVGPFGVGLALLGAAWWAHRNARI